VACEKCWTDAYFRHRYLDPNKSQSDHYHEILAERVLKPCSEKEQAGEIGEKE
jgi:hypothetical protein